MKLGLKALVIALVMALAAVPAAFAAPGNGHGGGKPSWAGHGKPSWAGSGHANGKAHHEQKAKKPKHHEADAATEEDSADDVDLDGLNPAWYCKTLQDEMTKLERDFASMFGTNPNHANAFGKCVSRRAHGEDLSDAAGGDDQQGDESCEASEPTASEDSEAESSDGEATDPEECESDDSDSAEPADDEQGQGDDEQGEDDQGQVEDDASGELDSSDLARALRFLRL